jgi:hypothetical protein
MDMKPLRRTILKAGCAAGFTAIAPFELRAQKPADRRRYHVCLAPNVVIENPELLALVADAGIDTVTTAGFFYGYWPYPIEMMRSAHERIAKAGMSANVINIPLGHPGDSLDAKDGDFPLTPPRHWRVASQPSGAAYVGTSLHAPATAENVEAIRKMRQAGFTEFLVDDDFRLARGPGVIGGCFCDDHRERFCRLGGYTPAQWTQLLDDVAQRRLTPLLRAWVEFTCDELTGSFRAQLNAADGKLGTMIMYLGAEKAGIRLKDYGDVIARVGELMFQDGAFDPTKGKTDELFSALFHRRFIRPELALSETTAFPADQLSARNMAAKLAVSTIADVRTTMFMSGLTPFPASHWSVLKPAMKRQAELHAKLMGHRPRGPFKHYWGQASRYVGDDVPFSLFLAAGVPFEVCDEPASDGWTFLSDHDADAAAAGGFKSAGTTFVHRPSAGVQVARAEPLAESLDAIFAFKARNVERLAGVPYVEQAEPVVCAWYPTARSVLLWNLEDKRKSLTLRLGSTRREVTVDALDCTLVEQIG